MAVEKLVRVILELVPRNSGAVRAALSQGAGFGDTQQGTRGLASVLAGFSKQRQTLEELQVGSQQQFLTRQAALNLQVDRARKDYEKALGAEEMRQKYGRMGAAAVQMSQGATVAVGALAALGTAVVGLAAKANPLQWERFSSAIDDLMATIGRHPLVQAAASKITGAIRQSADSIYNAQNLDDWYASEFKGEGSKEGLAKAVKKMQGVVRDKESFFSSGGQHFMFATERERQGELVRLLVKQRTFKSSEGVGDFRPATMKSLEGIGQQWRLQAFAAAGGSPEEKTAEHTAELVKMLREVTPTIYKGDPSALGRAITGIKDG